MAVSQRWMAWLMRHAMGGYERRVAERKRRLFAGATGRALEIGCGARANRDHLSQVEWIGMDPNLFMRPLVCAAAEALPVRDGAVDLVIATLVLCSVRDPERVLAEVRRVLRPGGRFLFLEHVAAAPGTGGRWAQRALRPACSFCADGCDPLRETGAMIARAGFAEVRMERFSLGFPHIAGCAWR
jgi:SAM-dependent methyltransferase